ncbi:hypothetical protein CUBB_gp214 [Staphylococcus phage CUB-B]|nr:hypothetical protein CUBB_gp214 [Staphylococcus phage CUB-B]
MGFLFLKLLKSIRFSLGQSFNVPKIVSSSLSFRVL